VRILWVCWSRDCLRSTKGDKGGDAASNSEQAAWSTNRSRRSSQRTTCVGTDKRDITDIETGNRDVTGEYANGDSLLFSGESGVETGTELVLADRRPRIIFLATFRRRPTPSGI
jgi:hypothetical protein